MTSYIKPKIRLHHEFLYLNHETIINSLSAFEFGKVDEIIQKISESRDAGVEGSIGPKSVNVTAGKKKSANIEEELKRTRTNFSAFDAWRKVMEKESAFGEFGSWDLETRNEISPGDTIRFDARISLSSVQKMFLTFLNYSKEAENQQSAMKQSGIELKNTKAVAGMISGWISDSSGNKSILINVAPFKTVSPRMSARLDETFLIGGTQKVEGDFTVIAQVESLIESESDIPVMRILRDVPPSLLEAKTIADMIEGMIDSAAGLGVIVTKEDLTLNFPGVILHPIAIYR
jgi:hypothetical protein